MATTPIELRTIPGLTLTADLFALGNDTVVQASITLTEQANRIGFYRGDITAAASGWHTLSVKLGTAVIDILDIADLADTTTLQYARMATSDLSSPQDIRDAMGLESTSGESSIDDKLNDLSQNVDVRKGDIFG